MIKIMDLLGRTVNTVAEFRRLGDDYMVVEVQQADTFKVKAVDLGHGHLEVTAVRQQQATEVDWSRQQCEDLIEAMEKWADKHADEIAERKRERSLKNAAQRAKVRVRQLCKAMGADTLLTLTYKGNQTDLDLCKAHLKAFNRRMERVIPGFQFVAAFEQQKRGAWHVHMACERLPAFLHNRHGKGRDALRVKSFDVIRAIWRSVAKEWGGNIDVARRKRTSQRSAARIASYISKYILKAYAEGEAFKNRWTLYGGCELPKGETLGQVENLREALDVVFGLMGGSHQVVVARLDRWKDYFVLHAESPA